MIKRRLLFLYFFCSIFILSFLLIPQNTFASNEISINAAGAVLIEKSTGRILFSKNKDTQMPMASCTKIVTAITVIDNTDLNNMISIPKQAVGIEGSSIYLKEGELLTVKELLYGLMLRSGNDSAVALAIHVGGSLENFASLMNEKAKSIGAYNSNFVTPHGLDAKNHYTTPYDLAMITAYALNDTTFSEIVNSKAAKIGDKSRGNERILYNKNKLLNNYEFADGVKTGFTKKAGRCFVGSATKEGMQLIGVVLNCGQMFEETQKMLEYGFKNFCLKTVVPKNKIFKINHKDKTLYLKSQNEINIVLKRDDSEKSLVEFEIDTTNISDPKLKISFAKKLLFSQKLSIIKR